MLTEKLNVKLWQFFWNKIKIDLVYFFSCFCFLELLFSDGHVCTFLLRGGSDTPTCLSLFWLDVNLEVVTISDVIGIKTLAVIFHLFWPCQLTHFLNNYQFLLQYFISMISQGSRILYTNEIFYRYIVLFIIYELSL